ncbi:MAG: DUF3883 domain-containing protein [Verrucomicrobia bacterium]|nr:DUF3883 domain-containing protein [Verrucomicrobiota bacterium]
MVNAIEKKAAIERVRKEFEDSKGTRIWTDYVNALKLVSQVVFTRSSGFVLELIQNAEDAGLGLEQAGEVTITISRDRLKFVHNGRPFDEKNLGAICGIRPSKKPEQGTLGYLGIGFKSVFKVSDCAEVYSNGYHFKFDRNHAEWSGQAGETPWHVIPVWIEEPSEPIDLDKTAIIVRFRDAACAESVLQGLKQLKAELYLFLKWLKKITVVDEISGAPAWTLENEGEKDGITVLKQDSRPQRFKFYRREVTVPEGVKGDRLTQEYRSNVTKREIAIAFGVDAKGDLDPTPASAMYGGVYSFLPLGESKSGAKFPIQADFLVQPGRDAINYESPWNHWLVDEVRQLCIEAIADVQKHPVWKYQFLAVFEFTKSKGYEAYDRLFGPELIGPIEQFLSENPCVIASDETWAKPNEVVRLTEEASAAKAIVDYGVLPEDQIGAVLGEALGLKLVHQRVAAALPDKFPKVDRWRLFENEDFLKAKAQAPDGAEWYRALYRWLKSFPFHEHYFYYTHRTRVKSYHGQEIIFTADRKLLNGGKVYLLDATITDPLITKVAFELQQTNPMLHPDILGGIADDKEREALAGFLIGLCGVQKLDAKAVCREALLPKILTTAPQPIPDELLDYTLYCQKHLSAEIQRGEAWVLTKGNRVRAAKQVYFPTEFRPAQNWEIFQRYVSGLDFLAPGYLRDCKSDEDFKALREFLKRLGVKEAPDNGVEEFAMNFACDRLQAMFRNIQQVEKRNFGYDLEAADQARQKVHIEVKGLSSDADVELTGNEANAADTHRDAFFLCVVSGIPNLPVIRLVQNPASVGKKDKLTIREEDWKAGLEVQGKHDGTS